MIRRCIARLSAIDEVAAARPLLRYNKILVSNRERPAQLIRDDFQKSFQPSQSLEDFAGHQNDVDELGAVLVRCLADCQAFDQMRFLFVNKLASRPRLSDDLCDAYLAALSKSETYTLEEVEGTIEVMRARGVTLDGVFASMAIAEMRARCGMVDLAPVMDALDRSSADIAPELHARYTHFVWTMFRSRGWSPDLIAVCVMLSERGMRSALEDSFNRHVVSTLLRDLSLPGNDVVEAVKQFVPAAEIEQAEGQHDLVAFLRTRYRELHASSISALIPYVKLDTAIVALHGVMMRRAMYDEGFDLYEANPNAFDGGCKWLNGCRPLSTAKADGMFFALERRKGRGEAVRAASLDAVMWACASLGDGTRAQQTLAAYGDFGLEPTDTANEALAAATAAWD